MSSEEIIKESIDSMNGLRMTSSNVYNKLAMMPRRWGASISIFQRNMQITVT